MPKTKGLVETPTDGKDLQQDIDALAAEAQLDEPQDNPVPAPLNPNIAKKAMTDVPDGVLLLMLHARCRYQGIAMRFSPRTFVDGELDLELTQDAPVIRVENARNNAVRAALRSRHRLKEEELHRHRTMFNLANGKAEHYRMDKAGREALVERSKDPNLFPPQHQEALDDQIALHEAKAAQEAVFVEAIEGEMAAITDELEAVGMNEAWECFGDGPFAPVKVR